jgi:hypothetical protein
LSESIALLRRAFDLSEYSNYVREVYEFMKGKGGIDANSNEIPRHEICRYRPIRVVALMYKDLICDDLPYPDK